MELLIHGGVHQAGTERLIVYGQRWQQLLHVTFNHSVILLALLFMLLLVRTALRCMNVDLRVSVQILRQRPLKFFFAHIGLFQELLFQIGTDCLVLLFL